MKKGNRGFTLIELTVALAVVVVIAGVVIVRFQGFSGSQVLAASARRLGNTIRTFREKAQYEETEYVMKLNLEDGRYQIFRISGRRDKDRPRPVRSGRLMEGVSFLRVVVNGEEEHSPVTISFDPRGVLPKTVLVLEGRQGGSVEIRLGTLINEISYEEPR